MVRSTSLLLLALLAWACGSTEPAPDGPEPATELRVSEPEPASPPPAGASAPVTVARFAGQRVTSDEVTGYLLSREPAMYERIVDELVLRRLVELEARRLGVTCSAADIERRVQQAVDEEVSRVDLYVRGQGGQGLETYLTSTGRNVSGYRAVLADRFRPEVSSKILFERLVRYWSLTSEWAEGCRIVVGDRRLAEEIRHKIELGASPVALARVHCLCPCKDRGGKLPRIHRDAADVPFAERLFAMEERTASDIVEEEGRFAIYVLLAVQRARGVAYSTVEGEVLASLDKKPLDPAESRGWHQAVVRRVGGVAYSLRP